MIEWAFFAGIVYLIGVMAAYVYFRLNDVIKDDEIGLLWSAAAFWPIVMPVRGFMLIPEMIVKKVEHKREMRRSALEALSQGVVDKDLQLMDEGYESVWNSLYAGQTQQVVPDPS